MKFIFEFIQMFNNLKEDCQYCYNLPASFKVTKTQMIGDIEESKFEILACRQCAARWQDMLENF